MSQDGERKGCPSAQLIVFALVVGISFIICTLIFTSAFVKVRSTSTITVTGSAEKVLKSDLIVWNGSFSRRSPSLSEAYTAMKKDLDEVKAFLKAKGVPDEEITVMPINMNTFYAVDKSGMQTSQITGYGLMQSVEVKSKRVDEITAVSRESSELINKGIEFQSSPPQYFYTKLSSLKVGMLADATKNARERAERIASQGGGKLGPLRSSKMGVFQITPVYSTEVSDYGILDTSSLEKKITAVVNTEFAIK
ncbi:MAG: SIMPL domain-containing protein [Bacillota bacterium]